MAELLLEIGCEEIPAAFLARALAELPAMVTARLAAVRLEHGEIKALGTPRRMAVAVAGVAERQPDLRERVVGPPAKAAFAADGTPDPGRARLRRRRTGSSRARSRPPRSRARRASTSWPSGSSPGARPARSCRPCAPS